MVQVRLLDEGPIRLEALTLARPRLRSTWISLDEVTGCDTGITQKEFDRVEADYSSLLAAQSTLEADHAALQTKQMALEIDYAALQTKQTALEQDYAESQTAQTVLREDYAELLGNEAEVRENYAGLQDDFSRLARIHRWTGMDGVRTAEGVRELQAR